MRQKNNRLPKKTSADVRKTTRVTSDVDRLRESEAKFRGFIENLAVMFYAAEPRPPYTPIYISPAFEQFGYPLEEWSEEMNFWVSVLHPDDRDWVLKDTEVAARAHAETDFEYRVIAKNGDVRWVRDRGSFVRDEAGNVICWQGIILDITESKLGEQKLQRNEKLYRTLAHNIPNTAVAMFDRDFRYTLAEGINLAKFGFSKEMFEGKTLSEVFPPDVAEEWSDYYRRALGGEIVSLEKRTTRGHFHAYVVPVKNECGEIFAGIVMWQDISERKRSEEAVKQSEKRYRQMFEKNRSIKLLIDADTGEIVDVNSAACNFYGYTSAEFKKKNITDINILPAEQVTREMKLAKSERRNYFHFRHRLASGELRDVEVNSSRLQDQNRNLLYSIIQDVTERRRTEQALRESEERYRDLFENANDLIYIHDLKGNYVSINRTAQRVFGYTLEEALKLNIKRIVVPEHLKLARRNMSDKVAGAKQSSYEVDCITKDGRRITLEINSRAIYQNGVPVAVQGIARDITERKQTEAALRDREEQYRDLIENANDLIYTHDLQGNFTSLNRAGESITGYTREEALQMNMAQVVAPEHLAAARAMIASKVAGEAPTTYELEIISKQGTGVSLELSTRIIHQNGKPIGIQGIGRDITERKRTEQALVNSERRYRSLGEGIMHQVWTAQPDGKLDYVNGRTLSYFGRTFEQVVGEGWQTLVHPEDLPATLERWQHSLDTGEDYEVEFRLQGHDGKYRWHQARATVGLDANGKISNWFGTNTDIEEQKIAEAKLNHFAGHDTLTNLPNRARFMYHLERAVSRAKRYPTFRFAVLFLDLDRFKVINDSLGHTIGDKLLVAIAKSLEECLRPNDIVARLGGDEFTVLLNNITDSSDAVRIANRFLGKLSEPLNLDSYEVFTSASIGIIISDDVCRQPEDFLRDADTAMYRAKEAGKSRYEIFDREMHIRNMNLLQLENDLRRAIEQNEFRVFYQPVVNLETGEVHEFEALIRWQHPQQGLVMPNDFIGIAEETGLIIPIGRWILEVACRQTAEWQKRFPMLNLSISVNLSAKQLMHPNLTAQISEILSETALNPYSLKLEVTESVVMENSDKALAVISELNKFGIELSTDDFGTGYSSLSYLHRFPFNRLKIDRSFVSKMDSDQKSEAIVRTILLLGQNLNIEVVAEGIETERQLQSLRELGCKTGQGYLFSKPVSAEIAARLLSSGLSSDYSPTLFPYSENDGREVVEVDKIQ